LLFPEFKPEAWSRTIRCERAAFEELKRVHVSPFEKAADFGEGIDPLAEVAEVTPPTVLRLAIETNGWG